MVNERNNEGIRIYTAWPLLAIPKKPAPRGIALRRKSQECSRTVRLVQQEPAANVS